MNNELTMKEKQLLEEAEKEILENIDYYDRIALTAEQQLAINEAKRNFYNSNKCNQIALAGLSYA